jgi:hypothetical protein
MFASPLYHQKLSAGKAPSTLPKYLNTGTLAFVMFLQHVNNGALAVVMLVALALLSAIRDKESATEDSAPGKSTKREVVIDKHHDEVPHTAAGRKMFSPQIPRQFMGGIINAFKGAFDDPSLIDYANQQGIGIPDSPTTPLPNTSSQSLASSKSPLSQSSRSFSY